jgi:hypothetical protein
MDDHSIPAETLIYFSKTKALFTFAIAIVIFIVGLYQGIANQKYIGCAFLVVCAIIISFFSFKKYKNREPQITINQFGIKTAAVDFYTWENVGNEVVTREHKNRATIICVEYDCPNGREEFNIEGLDIDGDGLAYLLSVYRERSGKKYKYDKLIGFDKST